MKISTLLFVLACLFTSQTIDAQSCSAGFTYTLSGNTITFSNTSTFASSVTPSYTWDTGNGMTYTTTAVTPTILTTYTSNGTYWIKLEMGGSMPWQCYSLFIDSIFVMVPGCSLVVNPLASGAPSPAVNFSSNATGTTGGTSYLWEFYPGATSTLANPTFTYPGNGLSYYTLTASNNATCTAFYQQAGIQWPQTLVNSYSMAVTYTQGLAGVVHFSLSGVYNNTSLTWNYGDPYSTDFGAATSNTAAHTFFNGTYTTVIQYQVGPYFSTFSVVITCTNNPCIVNSAYTYTQGTGGAVQFSPVATPSSSNIAYFWDFGDGTSSTAFSPNHVYISAGNYSTSLICYNITNSSCSQTSLAVITVTTIPCLANASFTLVNYTYQFYYIYPAYPWNVSNASWAWGDGSTYTGTNFWASHTYSAPGVYNIALTLSTTCGATASYSLSQIVYKGSPSGMISVQVVPSKLTIEGISEQGAGVLKIDMFPNPTNGMLYLNSDEALNHYTAELYDLLGNKVRSEKLRENESAIDLNELSNGIYTLHLKGPKNAGSRKIVISR